MAVEAPPAMSGRRPGASGLDELAVQVLERIERVVDEARRLLGARERERPDTRLDVGLRARRVDLGLDRHAATLARDAAEQDDRATVPAHLVQEELAGAQLADVLAGFFLAPAFCAAWATISASTKPGIRFTTVPGRRTTTMAGESVVPMNLTSEFALRSS